MSIGKASRRLRNAIKRQKEREQRRSHVKTVKDESQEQQKAPFTMWCPLFCKGAGEVIEPTKGSFTQNDLAKSQNPVHPT